MEELDNGRELVKDIKGRASNRSMTGMEIDVDGGTLKSLNIVENEAEKKIEDYDAEDLEYGKYLFSSSKANKDYLLRIERLQNRINKLMKHENEVLKKVDTIKAQSIREDRIRVQKLRDRAIIEHSKQERLISQDNLKRAISIEKEKRRMNISLNKSQLLEKNKEKYEVLKNDRQIITTLTTQVKNHYKNINSFNSLKIREAESKLRTNQIEVQKKRELESRDRMIRKFKDQEKLHIDLINKINELEEIETSCIKNLNTTIKSKAMEIQKFKSKLVKESELIRSSSQASVTHLSRISSSKSTIYSSKPNQKEKTNKSSSISQKESSTTSQKNTQSKVISRRKIEQDNESQFSDNQQAKKKIHFI